MIDKLSTSKPASRVSVKCRIVKICGQDDLKRQLERFVSTSMDCLLLSILNREENIDLHALLAFQVARWNDNKNFVTLRNSFNYSCTSSRWKVVFVIAAVAVFLLGKLKQIFFYPFFITTIIGQEYVVVIKFTNRNFSELFQLIGKLIQLRSMLSEVALSGGFLSTRVRRLGRGPFRIVAWGKRGGAADVQLQSAIFRKNAVVSSNNLSVVCMISDLATPSRADSHGGR